MQKLGNNGQKTDSLIAYNLLKKKIIDSGFCTQCGACEAACPVGALKINAESVTRTYDCSKYIDLCPICYEVCPHSEALLLRSLSFIADAPLKSEALGYFRKIMLAQASDPKIRELSNGGGVVTALLKFGIEHHVFDVAIVSQAEPESPAKPKASVATVSDDILSAVGTKFFPSAVGKAYGTASYGYENPKIALVSVPCHALALRKLEAWQHKISDNLKILIGLFCFETFSLKALLEYITKTYNIKLSDIKQMRLSKDLIIYTEKESINIPLAEVKDNILPSCRTCADFTSEFADISVGNAFPLADWSIVIVRTKIGEDFFSKAAEQGVINARAIEQEPIVFERLISAAIRKRTQALQEASKLEESHGFIPARLLRETELLSNVKVEDIMTKNVRTIPSDMTVSQLLELISKEHHLGYPVINEKGELVGIVTIEEASFVEDKKRSETCVGSIARPNLDVVYPGETALDAFKKMSAQETGRVLVLDPENPQRVIGIVTKADLLYALVQQS